MGQPDSALAAFRRFADTPTAARSRIFNLPLGYVYEQLARLYQARGEPAQATLYAGKLVDLWHGADPELQARVAAARELAARLARPNVP